MACMAEVPLGVRLGRRALGLVEWKREILARRLRLSRERAARRRNNTAVTGGGTELRRERIHDASLQHRLVGSWGNVPAKSS